ncbi:Peptidoglycan/LPS O-acetylase OafA/YrhL, contains acyltransferase and SGNH-hydrolase domains [Collimonas sp. OK607]|uniref:acyltransferase family protein n=1 Tax=Collimonas sp. OK607 TaxID=1798194 RepID=UPI0008EBF5C2|nr:acyltransferase [Collimonas sp. OK607]SFB14082.1 Peptidoglycan/LPS O-acetylase OafA/YrhL, contains acyltransferase and SGNH-hydrolase domains [Collimonas sp. OK607]
MSASSLPSASFKAPDRSSNFQFGFIDLLKVIAAQLIVLHHLAFYGPMSDHVRPIAPTLIGWLDDYARIAVQVFLVVGGFLAAKSLSPQGTSTVSDPLRVMWRRYMKLVPPFLVATVLAVGASAWAGLWMTHYSISAMPTAMQLAAHALLLHSILGYESISAGAWYVAIDFQLYALLTMLLWLSGGVAKRHAMPWLAPVLVVIGVSVSLLYFNRDASWDAWAPYFFGSYGLGAIAWWARDLGRRPAVVALLMAAILLPTLYALAIDFRSRIAVALMVACVLVLVSRRGILLSRQRFAWVRAFGRISYSIFLVHFPVCLIVNAAFVKFVPARPLLQAGGMVLAWAASLAAGAIFYRWVEIPLSRLSARASGQSLALQAPATAQFSR